MDEGAYEGGCFCGAVRYRFEGVFDAGYCHCSICRRTTGAPAIAWVNTPRPDFAFLKGTPKVIRSSERFERLFCDACGTIMLTRAIDRQAWDYVSIHHGTIDDAASIHPKIHICCDDRLPWFEIADDLPRVADNRLPHPDRRSIAARATAST